jgi:hypothetical protein
MSSVQGPTQADTGDGRQQRLWCNDNNNDDKEEDGLHPTPPTTVMCELVERLRSVGCQWRQAEEEEEGNVDDDSNNEHINGHVRGPRRADTGDGRR